MRQAIKALFAAGVILLSAAAVRAEGGVEAVWLAPSDLNELGFSVEIVRERAGIDLTLRGPRTGPNSCSARRSGIVLLDVDGQEVAGGSTYWAVDSEEPRVHAFLGDGWRFPKMAVYLDYLCPADRLADGRRYGIRDVKAFVEASERDG